MNTIWNYSLQKFPIYIPDINPTPHQLKVVVFDMARTKKKDIFHHVEYVYKLDQGRLCQTRNFLFVSNKSFWNYLYM